MIFACVIILVAIFNFLFISYLINYSKSDVSSKVVRLRDIHIYKTPSIGGVSFFVSFILSFILFYFIKFFPEFTFYNLYDIVPYYHLKLLLLSSFIMFIIGFFDDVFNLRFQYKFLFQLFVSIITVYYLEVRIESFYGIFGSFDFSNSFLNIFSVLVVIFIINSYNFVDGVDGLASSLGILILFIFSILFYFNDCFFDFFMCLILKSILLSFLYFNKPTAKIFMGDSGSLFIGYLISYFSLKLCNLPIDHSGTINPVFILCILSYPAIDTLRVFFIRVYNRKSPFFPDKNHIHHFIINNNFNHIWVACYSIFYTMTLTSICYLLRSHLTLSFFAMILISVILIYKPILFFCKNSLYILASKLGN